MQKIANLSIVRSKYISENVINEKKAPGQTWQVTTEPCRVQGKVALSNCYTWTLFGKKGNFYFAHSIGHYISYMLKNIQLNGI